MSVTRPVRSCVSEEPYGPSPTQRPRPPFEAQQMIGKDPGKAVDHVLCLAARRDEGSYE